MDIYLISALIMVWIVVIVLIAMTYIGYDIRSRGIKSDGWALTTMTKNGITISDYFRKRDTHPVVSESDAETARTFRVLTFVCIIALIAVIIWQVICAVI